MRPAAWGTALLRLALCAGLSWPVLAPRDVWAGAWLLPEGEGFFSNSGTVRQGDTAALAEGSIHAAYGLRPWLTLGVDVFERPVTAGHALIFLRLPLGRTDRRNRVAIELGLGAHHDLQGWAPMQRLGLSWGRSLGPVEGPARPGWLSVDLTRDHLGGDPLPLYKLDSTLSLWSRGRFQPILQAELAGGPGRDLGWAITPGLLFTDAKDRTWHLGVERRFAGTGTLGLKLGLWLRF